MHCCLSRLVTADVMYRLMVECTRLVLAKGKGTPQPNISDHGDLVSCFHGWRWGLQAGAAFIGPFFFVC